MHGLHLTAELHECQCSGALLLDPARLADTCRQALAAAGLAGLDEKFVREPSQGGVSGTVLLARAHFVIHTRPEEAGVTLDIHIAQAPARAEALLAHLLAAFSPTRHSLQRLDRKAPQARSQDDQLLLQWLNPDCAFGFRATRCLETRRTPYQTLEVFETPQWGRLFRLDGRYMTSEGDEFFYHEALVHPMALSHPGPRSALVLGGGDGGSSEELLKYPGMERVLMAELDAQVLEIAKTHLNQVHHGVFGDPRLEVRIGDGWALAHDLAAAGATFDLIVMDLTDPDSPAHRLYSREFFLLAKGLLAPGGALALHLGSPIYKPAQVSQLLAVLNTTFSVLRPLGLYIPLYGSYWAMAVASDALDPLHLAPAEIGRRLKARAIGPLGYYNPDTHHALFALPNFFRNLLTREPPK